MNANRRLPLFFLLYLISAIVITHPLITVIATDFVGHPFGDSAEYAGHIGWMIEAVRTGQDPFYQPRLLYPDGLSAAWLWAVPLQSFPAILFASLLPGQSLPLALNTAILLTLALNGTAMAALVRHVLECQPFGAAKGRDGAAFLAGLIYLSYPTFQGHIAAAHTGLLTLWGAPLFLLFSLRLLDRRSKSDALWAGICFALSVLGSPALLIYLTLPITLVVLFMAWRSRQGLVYSTAALMIGGLILLPFFAPFLYESARGGSIVNSGASVVYSAPLMGIISPSAEHPLYRVLEYPARVIGGEPFENTAYAGVITAALASIGFVAARRSRLWLILAAGAWVLSLGVFLKIDATTEWVTVGGIATPIPLPYRLISELPLVSLSRTPARFNFAVGFALAILAGYGSAWVLSKLRTGLTPAVLIAAVLILFDHQVWWDMPTTPALIPDAIANLRESGARAVFNVPFEHPIVDKEGLYLQTAHGLPMIAGHIARETPLDLAKGTLLQQTLDPALLDAAGIDVIIVHREWDDEAGILETSLREQFGTPTFEDSRFALYTVPSYAGEPTGLVQFNAPVRDDLHRLYVYAPTDGDYLVSGFIQALPGREIRLEVDGTVLLEWAVPDSHGLRLPVRLTAGYHTISLNGDPRCGVIPAPALVCSGIQAELAIAHGSE